MRKYKYLLATLISVFLCTTAFAAFDDVPTEHDNYDAINYVQSQGIVEGYPDGTYKPDQPINRAEFTKIVIASKYTSNDIESCIGGLSDSWLYVYFNDVRFEDWFAKFVCLAKTEEIVDGYPDGSFQPANYIKFSEASKIIVNTLVENTEPGTNVWYKPYVEVLASKSAIPTTIVDFAHNVTRGEMAEMIYRIKKNITDKESLNYADLSGEVVIKEFDMTARQYEFDPVSITVNAGDTVRLNITSTDVRHGFAIDELGINEVIYPHATTTIEFVADEPGVYTFYCSVYCGSGHSIMKGTLRVE